MSRAEMRMYHNPWIPAEAIRILNAEAGTILDVGGGAAPYCRANHIVDIQPFDAERLRANQWGRGIGKAAGGNLKPETGGTRCQRSEELEQKIAKNTKMGSDNPTTQQPNNPTTAPWTSCDYTQLDLCGGQRWPFADKQFDLGLCSHCLEDLRDPIAVVKELSRVCRRTLIIAPSRLLEQTMNIDHPRYCGFSHHPWMVFVENGNLVFRRKTPVVNLRGCHLVCPTGMTLKLEYGAIFFHGSDPQAVEQVFWNERDDYEDYCRFIEPCRNRDDLFEPDGRRHDLKYWAWRMRQRYLGAL